MKIRNIALLLSLLIGTALYGQPTDMPSAEYQQIYAELKEKEESLEVIDREMRKIPYGHPDRNYFDVLKITECTYCGKWEELDSLYLRVKKHFTDTQNKIMLSEIHALYGTALNAKGDYEQARVFLHKQLEAISSLTDNPNLITKHQSYKGAMLYELGFGYMQEQRWEDAIYYTEKSIEALGLAKDSATLVNAYNLSGVILKRAGHPEQAIEHYKKAFELNQKHQDDPLGRLILQNIASLYTDIDQFDKALEFSRKIFNYFPVTDSLSIGRLNEYINTLCTVGVILCNNQLYQNAQDTMNLAVSWITPETPAGLKMLAYSVYGRTNSETKRTERAKAAFDSAFTYLPQTKHQGNIANLHFLYGTHLWKEEKNYKLAEVHFLQAYNLIEKFSQIGRVAVLKNMSTYYEEVKNYPKAYLYATQMHDRYVTEQKELSKKRTAAYEVEFKTKEKEREVSQLQEARKKEQREFQFRTIISILFLTIAALVIILLAVLLRKRRLGYTLSKIKLQQIIDQEAKQKEKMLAEMNQKMSEQYLNGLESSNQHMAKELHDGVCNQLLSLEMVYGANNPELAQAIQSIRSEARLISHSLATPEFALVSLQQTLDKLLAELRKMEYADFELFIDEEVKKIRLSNVQQREIYRIIQEAISNILKHAHAQKVYITLSKQEEKLFLMIEDDGKGFDFCTNESCGFGLTSMRERAKNINAELTIESQAGSGTIITLSMQF